MISTPILEDENSNLSDDLNMAKSLINSNISNQNMEQMNGKNYQSSQNRENQNIQNGRNSNITYDIIIQNLILMFDIDSYFINFKFVLFWF